MEIGVLIADDEEDIRLLIRAMIEAADDGLSVRGEAADGAEAVAKTDTLGPEVVVLDQRMPGLTGIEAAGEILSRRPGQRIILCSAFLDEQLRAQAEAVGIRICLTKNETTRIPAVVREMMAS